MVLKDVCCLAAEYARRFVFAKNDIVIFNENLNRVVVLDVEGLSKFHRQDDSTQHIKFSHDTGTFHISLLTVQRISGLDMCIIL